MATIPAGVIFAWPSTAASIPANFTRVTSLDARYLKGAANGVEPDTTGGAATHTHVSPSHSHTVPSHSHSGPANSSDGTSNRGNDGVGSPYPITLASHTHTGGTSGAQTANATGTVATFNTGSNDPAYYEVIFVESDGTPTRIPTGMWAWWDGVAVPTNWTHPAAGKDVYLKGAAAAGNGGGTGGGSHVHTGVAHTHGIDNHTHSNGTSGTASAVPSDDGSPGNNPVSPHDHPEVYAAGASGTSASGTTGDTSSTTAQPPYIEYSHVQQGASGDDLPTGIIAAWLGLRVNIPANWAEVTAMRDNYVRGTTALGDAGTTGGATSHDHTDPATHTHTTTSHSHSVTYTAASTTGLGVIGVGFSQGNHTHTGTSSTATPGTSGGTAQTVDSATTAPPYRTVIFIEYVPPVTSTAAFTIPVPTMAAAGGMQPNGVGALTMPVPTMAAAAVMVPDGVAAFTLPMPTMAATGAQTHTASAALTIPLPTLAATSTQTIPSTAAFTIPVPTLSGSGVLRAHGSVTISAATYGSVTVAYDY